MRRWVTLERNGWSIERWSKIVEGWKHGTRDGKCNQVDLPPAPITNHVTDMFEFLLWNWISHVWAKYIWTNYVWKTSRVIHFLWRWQKIRSLEADERSDWRLSLEGGTVSIETDISSTKQSTVCYKWGNINYRQSNGESSLLLTHFLSWLRGWRFTIQHTLLHPTFRFNCVKTWIQLFLTSFDSVTFLTSFDSVTFHFEHTHHCLQHLETCLVIVFPLFQVVSKR